MSAVLWAVWCPGSEIIHAAPSEAAARHMAAKVNAELDEYAKANADTLSPYMLESIATMRAIATTWDDGEASHAEDLAKNFRAEDWDWRAADGQEGGAA